MKKVLFLTVSILVLGLIFTAGSTAVDVYDMWKGEFIRSNPAALLETGETGGEVIINYVKGQKAYMVNIQAYGLDPNTTYQAWLMTTSGFANPSDNHMLIGELIVDDDGFGRLHRNGVSPEDLDLDRSNIRIVIYRLPRVSGSWILSTSVSVTGYNDLLPIGSNREEQISE